MKYIVELSDAEQKALSCVAVDPEQWVNNVVHERCRVAIEEIVSLEVQRLLNEGKPITGTKDDIVLASNIETAAEREIRLEEEYKKFQEDQQG